MPFLAAAAPAIIPIVMQIAGMLAQQDSARSAVHNIQDVPSGANTGYSSVSQSGNVFMDPSLRALRQSLLGQYQQMYPQATSAYGNLLTQAGQNSPGYVQSAVDPLKQQINAMYGDTVLRQERGGIRGSSLAGNELTDFANTTGRALADATASATNQSIGLQAGLEGQMLGAQGNILGAQEGINNDQLKQELAALGLGQNEIALMLQRGEALNRAKGGGSAGLGGGLMGLGSLIGNIPGLGGAAGGGGAISSFGVGDPNNINYIAPGANAASGLFG